MAARDDDRTSSGGANARRIDQWLWFARVVKSRTQAAELVAAGKARVNRERVEKPSHALKIGDVVTVTAHARVRILKVAGLGVRRGPPAEAATLFEDLTPPPEPRDPVQHPAPPAERVAGTGRPTKRDRRALDKLRDRDD